MSLQEEIKEKASQIYTESYQMSIGELINLYKDNEMDIHPEFQRVFRWSNLQKTKLIESIMLNIPIPPIFVSQREDGVWDVVDGVQRLSTIFQFIGELKDEDGKDVAPLVLEGTEYLPSFDGMRWFNESDAEKSFTRDQQLVFKRARLDIRIVKKESDPNAKYELFQRLNTGGTNLSEQEVRNCLMIMLNIDFYRWMDKLTKMKDFEDTINISDRLIEEQYKMELILRLLVARFIDFNTVNSSQDITDILTKEMIKICKMEGFPYADEEERFTKTFSLLNNLPNISGGDVFKRFNKSSGKFIGAFLSTGYQTIAYGVMKNFDNICKLQEPQSFLSEKIKNLYEEVTLNTNMASGVRASQKFKELSLFGARYFNA